MPNVSVAQDDAAFDACLMVMGCGGCRYVHDHRCSFLK